MLLNYLTSTHYLTDIGTFLFDIGPALMHNEHVQLAQVKCPKYQDMDGNCLGTYLQTE